MADSKKAIVFLRQPEGLTWHINQRIIVNGQISLKFLRLKSTQKFIKFLWNSSYFSYEIIKIRSLCFQHTAPCLLLRLSIKNDFIGCALKVLVQIGNASWRRSTESEHHSINPSTVIYKLVFLVAHSFVGGVSSIRACLGLYF